MISSVSVAISSCLLLVIADVCPPLEILLVSSGLVAPLAVAVAAVVMSVELTLVTAFFALLERLPRALFSGLEYKFRSAAMMSSVSSECPSPV